MKTLFTFTIDKEVEKEFTEETPEGKLTKKIKEKIPVKFGLKKPNRSIVDSSELFYGVQLATAIKEGLMPRALLAKRFSNDNGIFSDGQIAEHQKLSNRFLELRNEIVKYNVLPKEERTEDIEKKFSEQLIEATNIQTRLSEYENIQNSLFENTAENRAKYKTVLWYALFLSYIEEDGNFKPLFKGETFKEKLDSYDKIEEENNLFYIAAIQRFSLFVTYLYHGKANTEEDFKTLNDEFLVKSDVKSSEPVITSESVVIPDTVIAPVS